ncbi:MAG: DNA polymerase III subunit delta [Prevotellaceae bacterium]|jgi:DNA polymerase-3 subunit delta|nr:DNA polymerase III subunit delta [Prevotellaceae bacterium]
MAKKFTETITDYKRITGDLQRRIYKPVYLLMGEEPYYIDQISQYIAEHVLTETERGFDRQILYGMDITTPQLIDTARRYPMVANHQVVIVREAQDMKKIELLEAYVRKPLASTILVLCYKGKTVDRRTSFYKLTAAAGEVFETAKLYDNDVEGWIINYLKEKNCIIDPKANNMLMEYVGHDLSKIIREIDKLFTLLPEGSKHITAEHIEKNIGISKDYNTFELNAAIFRRDVVKANRILNHFAQNPTGDPMILTINALFLEFSRVLKLHFLRYSNPGNVQDRDAAAVLGTKPYFLKDYRSAAQNYSFSKTLEVISLLRDYDMRSKGFGNGAATHGDLLRELVFRIMH